MPTCSNEWEPPINPTQLEVVIDDTQVGDVLLARFVYASGVVNPDVSPETVTLWCALHGVVVKAARGLDFDPPLLSKDEPARVRSNDRERRELLPRLHSKRKPCIVAGHVFDAGMAEGSDALIFIKLPNGCCSGSYLLFYPVP